jgi:hypothetical protein
LGEKIKRQLSEFHHPLLQPLGITLFREVVDDAGSEQTRYTYYRDKAPRRMIHIERITHQIQEDATFVMPQVALQMDT